MELRNKNILIISRDTALDSYIIGEFSKHDCNLYLVSNKNNLNSHIQTSADPGKIKFFKIDITKQGFFDFINNNKHNIDAILYLAESFKNNQNKVNNLIPTRLSEIAKSRSFPFIYFSRLDIKNNQDTSYGRTKFLGEINIHKKNTEAIVIRHGITVGKRDNFLNYFVRFASFSKFFILPKTESKFVVVDLSDLAKGSLEILSNFSRYSGQIFELYTDQIYSYETITEKVFEAFSKKYKLLKLPVSLFSLIGLNSELRKLITKDCLPSKQGLDFSKLSIEPNSINSTVEAVTLQFISSLSKQKKLIN